MGVSIGILPIVALLIVLVLAGLRLKRRRSL